MNSGGIMKAKIMFLSCMLIFSGLLYAQNKRFHEFAGTKGMMEGIPEVTLPQALQRDRPRVIVLTAYITNGQGFLNHFVNRASVSELRAYIEYTALFNTQVRFYFIFTGPEIVHHTTDWYSATVNNYSYVYLKFLQPQLWKKATYKLTIIA